MRAHALPALILLAAALTACGDKKSDGPERKTAAGEVLGGSISDAMLPLATVTSQSPPLRESAAGAGGTSEDTSAGSDDDADATPAADASPEASAAGSASATPQTED
jgi:hypothetical protein